MKIKQYIHCFSLLAFILLGGCAFEDQGFSDATKTNVEIQFSVAQPDVALTRAVEMGDLADEAKVTHLTLFASGATWQRFDFDYGTGGVTAGLFYSRLTLDAGTYTFYAIANAPTGLLDGVTSKADLDALIADAASMPASPFIMTGTVATISISSTEKVPVRLERLVAKIDVTNQASNFTFSGVQLHNVPKSSFLLPRKDSNNKDGWTITPNPLDRVNYSTEIAAAGNKVENKIYCYEAFNKDAQNIADNVSLIVHGAYKGQDGYYRIDIRDFRGRQWIRRNTRYEITIKDVTGYGYSTPDQAMANKPANMVLGLATRGDEDITSEYMVFDGEYFLGSSVYDVEANFDPTIDETYNGETVEAVVNAKPYEVRIVTNAPAGWEYILTGDKLANFDHPQFGTLTDYTWMFVKRDQADQDLLLLDFYNLYNNETTGQTPDNRTANISIQAKGRPNLKLDLPVFQLNLDSYYERIEADPDLFISNGKQVDVFVADVATTFNQTQWKVKEVISSTGNTDWISIDPGIDQIQTATGKLRMEVQPLPDNIFFREAFIVLTTVPSTPGVPAYTKTVRVISGLDMTYQIQYPAGTQYYDDLNRTKRVIETPLNQEKAYDYTVNVQSSQNWKVLASHPWITVTQPVFQAGSYNTSFKVTVAVNPGNGTDIGGLKKAREGYVDILGDQIHHRIMVYQGGYVQIGQDIWMDRNLYKSRYSANIGGQYSYYADLRSSGLRIDQMLYPAAVPIAFDGAMTACYGKHRGPTNNSVLTTSISNYSPTYGHYYTNSTFSQNYDGYFGWGQPGTYMYRRSSLTKYCWDANYVTGKDILDENVKKGLTDPCPAGWRTPSYAELRRLSTFLNKGVRKYYSGLEDLKAPRTASDVNNGLFFYNADKVSCWYPFAGHRGSTIENNSTVLLERGKSSRYFVNNTPDGINVFYLGYNAAHADITLDNMYFGSPIRCVKE